MCVTQCFAVILSLWGPSSTRSSVCHHFFPCWSHLLEYIVIVDRGEALGVRLLFFPALVAGVADDGTTAALLSSSIAV